MDTHDTVIPAPPPFALSTDIDPSCEHDIDMDDTADEAQLEALALRAATIPEGVEWLGEYPTLDDYFKGLVEPLIDPSIAGWLLDCIDWQQVQLEHEQGGARYYCEAGQVYVIYSRTHTPADPAGPWMPFRGGE